MRGRDTSLCPNSVLLSVWQLSLNEPSAGTIERHNRANNNDQKRFSSWSVVSSKKGYFSKIEIYFTSFLFCHRVKLSLRLEFWSDRFCIVQIKVSNLDLNAHRSKVLFLLFSSRNAIFCLLNYLLSQPSQFAFSLKEVGDDQPISLLHNFLWVFLSIKTRLNQLILVLCYMKENWRRNFLLTFHETHFHGEDLVIVKFFHSYSLVSSSSQRGVVLPAALSSLPSSAPPPPLCSAAAESFWLWLS